MQKLVTEIRTSLIATFSLALILCGIYPLLVWGVAQVGFPEQANGSLIVRKDVVIGSQLIAQRFSDAHYFHPRPSAAGTGYDAASSGGSNLGPLSQKLIDLVTQRIVNVRTENNLPVDVLIPADAVTASGSGLDPHISVANAVLQAPRVARARGIPEETVFRMVEEYTEGRTLGFLGEPRVNVLMINLALNGNQ